MRVKADPTGTILIAVIGVTLDHQIVIGAAPAEEGDIRVLCDAILWKREHLVRGRGTPEQVAARKVGCMAVAPGLAQTRRGTTLGSKRTSIRQEGASLGTAEVSPEVVKIVRDQKRD